MTKRIIPISEDGLIYSYQEKPHLREVPRTETIPIYQMGKKQLKVEMEQLDLFLKKTFIVTDAKHLQQYVRSEKEILPPYYPLFDAYSNWLTDEILLPADPRARGFVIKRAIKLAQFFYHSGNFQAYLITLSALQQQSILRLRQSWNFVPKKYDAWMLSEIDVCFTGNHGYLRKAMNNYTSPFFPHLLVYKKDYQNVLGLYKEKSLDLEKNPSAQRELTELSRRMQEISFQVSRLHSLLTSAISNALLLPSSFVSGVQKWEGYFNPEIEQRFLNCSKLLE